MLHVIFVILKVLGIILGGLLALLLLLLGIVLFVPVRYRIRAAKYETIHVKAKASWLFHIVDVRFRFYQEEETYSYCIRIFGYPFMDSNRPPKEKKAKKPRRTREEKRAAKMERRNASKKKAIDKANNRKLDSIKENISKDNGSKESSKETIYRETIEKDTCLREIISKDTTEKSSSNKAEEPRQAVVSKTMEESKGNANIQAVENETIRKVPQSIDTEKNVDMDRDEEESFISKILKPIRAFFRKIAAIPRKIKERIQRIRKMLRSIKDKVHHIKELLALVKAFFDDEENRKGLKCVFQSLKKTLKHILPYRIKGVLRVGLEDPCDTGMLLGGLSIFYPLYENKIQIIPDFQEEVLEGKVDAKGRIRTCTLLIIGIKLLLDNNFKTLLKNARELKEEL